MRLRTRRRGTVRGLLLLAALAAALLSQCGEEPATREGDGGRYPGAELSARVLEVTDGDTIVVRLADGTVERVRYIGIDTPESNPDQPLECFGPEAAAVNRELVEGREVRLRLGREVRDDYGRLLAYVRAGDVEVNERLLAGGYARTLEIAPNDERAAPFARLEAEAGRTGRGLWGACAE